MRWAIAFIVCATVAATAWLLADETAQRAGRSLSTRLEQRVRFGPDSLEPCPPDDARRTVILVLGQSNAGNHGAEEMPPPLAPQSKVLVFDGLNCHRVGDPLPGATGTHRSIWSQVASRLSNGGTDRTLVFTVFAVESTTIADWIQVDGPIRKTLERLLVSSIAMGLNPNIVVWQQGESDAQVGTSASDYSRGLRDLVSIVRTSGVNAPIVAALSTRCGKHGPSMLIRGAIIDMASGNDGVRLGPDTDAITGDLRNRDCHFSEEGLSVAAHLWAETLARLLP